MPETVALLAQHPVYYNYNVMNFGFYVMEKPVVYDSYYYEQNEVLYCATASQEVTPSVYFEKVVQWEIELSKKVVQVWLSVDPKASSYPGLTPYNYCANSPVVYVDPNGENPWAALGLNLLVSAITYVVNVASSPGGFENWDWGQFAFSTLLGAATGAFSMGIGNAVNGALTPKGVGGAAAGAISGAVAGFVSGAINGMAQASITGDKNAIWKSALMGMGMGAAIGGITGGIEAAIKGENFWVGGPTLKTKLAIIVEQNRAALDATAGVADANVHLGTRANVKEYGGSSGYSYEWGNIFDKDGIPVNAFSVSGDTYDVSAAGLKLYSNNNIVIDKNTVRLMWNGNREAFETLFHEWRHCHEFFTGNADFMRHLWGSDAKALSEVFTHQFNYSRFPTVDRLETIRYYQNLLSPGTRSFFGY